MYGDIEIDYFSFGKKRRPLEGRHAKLRCETCHLQPAPLGRKAAPLGRDCMACHRKDDVHEGRFGRRCEQCHTNDDWKRLRQGVGAR